KSFDIPVLIIEGEGLFTKHQANVDAIRSALLSIMIDFGVRVIFSKDFEESVSYLYNMARREQEAGRRQPRLRGEKKVLSLSERQVYIVEGLPSVSSTLARRLLGHFGSISAIFNASVDELMKVEGVGKKIANKIKEISTTHFGD
ncbi:MAG: ERCC4 domain-containing protein, partial [Candidatus Methanofastidiosia archaeon]